MRRKKNLIINLLIIVFTATFLISGFYIGRYYYTIYRSEKAVSDLKKLIGEDDKITDTNQINTDQSEEKKVEFTDIDGVQVQNKFVKVYKKNKDFIGWLTISGTKIDYPVMHTPNNEEYYLRNDFKKNWSIEGTPFAAGKCDPLKPSDNVIIYGHNMNTGTLFGELTKYADKGFYESHKYIEFDTIKEDALYEVIATFKTEIDYSNKNAFKYYNFFDANDKTEFDDYVKKAKEASPYQIETTANYGDKLLTLSTCSYHKNQGRYVVVAKRIMVNNKLINQDKDKKKKKKKKK